MFQLVTARVFKMRSTRLVLKSKMLLKYSTLKMKMYYCLLKRTCLSFYGILTHEVIRSFS